MQRVAIIGGGGAGMGAAHHLLDLGHEVTLFEERSELGGNCFSVELPDAANGAKIRVDGGVSDYNRTTSPTFDAFLDHLGVQRQSIVDDASFMTSEGHTVWTNRQVSPPAPRGHTPHGRTLPWLSEKKQFEREAMEVLSSPFYDGMTTLNYLDAHDYSDDFRRFYLYPRASGCFTMPDGYPGHYPILSLVRYWANHGLMGPEPADRVRVAGGMHRYAEAMASRFVRRGGRLLCSHRVLEVRRQDPCRPERQAYIQTSGPNQELVRHRFDHVVFTVFPNRAVELLADATAAERLLASLFEYQPVRVVTHQDETLMPTDRNTWAAANYLVPNRGESVHKPTLTSYINRLGHLDRRLPDVFVTLNPRRDPDPTRILDERWLTHPKPGPSARQTTALVHQIQGRRQTWWCGSYLEEPFLHEQAFASGAEVAKRLSTHLKTRPRKKTKKDVPFGGPTTRCLISNQAGLLFRGEPAFSNV